MQTTLAKPVKFTGTGLHTGRPAKMTVRPAGAGAGIVFRRLDVDGVQSDVRAHWSNVIVSPLNTRIENSDGVSVSTIEHIMAALAGCGIHNALIEISGPEVPILDGSSARFVRGLLVAGLERGADPLDLIEVLKPVSVHQGDASAELRPASGLRISFTIDFADAAIGHQFHNLDLANGTFVRELCDSRTFCRKSDVDAMHANGLALGGNYDNAVVVDGDRILSTGGLRHANEAVRHKMLDALGDLNTAGAPILGHYVGVRAGHALTNRLLQALFASQDNWRLRRCDPATAARLPGAGIAAKDLIAVA